MIDDRLLKIIELAKQGIGGERTTAIEIVKKRCEQLDLDFDTVMESTNEKEYMLEIPIRNEYEMTIVAQVCWHFAVSDSHPSLQANKKARVFFYTCTAARHIETVNAASVYLQAFRKERKKFMDDLTEAFVRKHRLFSTLTKDNDESPAATIDMSSIEKQMRQSAIAGAMDDVTIRKGLKSGDI